MIAPRKSPAVPGFFFFAMMASRDAVFFLKHSSQLRIATGTNRFCSRML